MAKYVEDLALAMSVMAGPDPYDSTSVGLPGAASLAPLAPMPLKGAKIGYFSGGGAAAHPSTKSCAASALGALEAQGAIINEIDLPAASYALETYCLLNMAESSSNLSRFDSVGFGCRMPSGDLSAMIAGSRGSLLGPEVKRRIMLGTFCLSKGHFDAYYLKALKARNALARSVTDVFSKLDFIAAPVAPMAAFSLGEKMKDPMEMYMMDVLTVLPALADIPALSVPAGLAGGLPVGVQFIGPRLSDFRVLQLGHTFQHLTDHHTLTPVPAKEFCNCPN
jgi:aspartyl-tRNA(Asn)/glutamyl-tRNA(Gln) amidotransferase subunit A